jgi:peroxiredoxin
MDAMGRHSRITIGFLVAIILLLIIQNFFLVKKVNQHLQTIAHLTDRLNRLSVMAEGDTIHGFSAMTLDSTQVQLDPAGQKKMKVMFVFTTGCGACVKNMEHWLEIVPAFQNDGVDVFGICPDSLYRIREYNSRFNLPFPVYSIAQDSTVSTRYKLLSYPQTIVIDAAGLVRGVWVGVLDGTKKAEIMHAVRGSTRK